MADPFLGQAIATSLFVNLTAAQLTAANRILQKYEIARESDTGKMKMGDGSTAWTSLGYIDSGLYVNNQSAAYTLALTDAGGLVSHPVGDNNARTFTIPANSAVPFPIGTVIQFTNEINSVSIAITTDTLKFGASGTGTRTLAVGGTATITKLTSTIWRIVGTELT